MRLNNEVCLAWVEDALRLPRAEEQTRVVGYLEAVSDEVRFEMKREPSAMGYDVASLTEGALKLEEGA